MSTLFTSIILVSEGNETTHIKAITWTCIRMGQPATAISNDNMTTIVTTVTTLLQVYL